jgi:chorismate mutase/prephenate dehydratase
MASTLMSKKKPILQPPTVAPGAATPTRRDVRPLRSAIDDVDRQIVELANQRARLAQELATAKQADGQAVYDSRREDEVLRRVATLNDGPLGQNCIDAVFRELISGSRAVQAHHRVAYLGPAFSYSHLAAIHRFGQSAELVSVASISAVFEEVVARQSEFGLVPVENSTDGRIADTLDNFARHRLRICGEVQLRIHHNLLGLCPRADVQEIYSRPQALSQCRNWLAKHQSGARLVEMTSTAAAAQIAREKPGAAAIASRQAGVNYGLDVLAANIEDNPTNVTRFAVLGHESGPRTGDDKSALMFELAHRPGTLADAIAVFKRHRVNLTWLESFPMTGPDGGYLFFVELIGHQADARVRRAVAALAKRSVRLEVLGSYARGEVCE